MSLYRYLEPSAGSAFILAFGRGFTVQQQVKYRQSSQFLSIDSQSSLREADDARKHRQFLMFKTVFSNLLLLERQLQKIDTVRSPRVSIATLERFAFF